MIPDNACVLVAVSGGLDSVVLLDVLIQLSVERPFSVVVGHVDHGLRERASTRDAAFVREMAAKLDVPVVSHRLSEQEWQQAQAQGREGAARQARYQALHTLADSVGATRIALGHTLDDHVETMLHHLARGTGPTGLRGIPASRLPFIRPLMQASRDQLLSYARTRELEWREDASNADLSYTRNRIRQQILPEFKALNPRFCDALSRSADLLADLDDAARFLAAEQLRQLGGKQEGSELTLHRSELADMPSAVCRLLLREAFRSVRGTLEGIERTHVDALINLLKGQRAHGELALPRLHVRIQDDRITLSTARTTESQPWDIPAELGVTRLPDGEHALDLEIIAVSDASMESARVDSCIEFADADCIDPPLRVRTRQSGDRFAPLGMTREMKLKNFLINERAPFFDRDRIPLLCDRNRIIWIAGMRLSETVKLSDRTKRVLKMRIRGVE